MNLWTNIFVPVASMLITVFATVYTVSKRVENENKEKHKPYLTLNNIEYLKQLDEYKYYYKLKNKEKEEQTNLNVLLLLENIGYGVASNIKLYNLSIDKTFLFNKLLTSEEIKGAQTLTNEKNQKLFTTFDIAINQQKKVQFQIEHKIDIKAENKILCVYQDLNGNVYDFIINIDIKTNDTYDFYTYQRTSHSYNKLINQNQNYNKIMNEYKK